MRRSGAILATGALVIATLVPNPAAAKTDDGLSPAERKALAAGAQVAPKQLGTGTPTGPNPYLALLPDPAKADYAGWQKFLRSQGTQRAADRSRQRALAPTPLLVDEDEPVGTRGGNDSPATAQLFTGFGTGARQNPRARILGELSPEQVVLEAIAPNTEDDGAIPLARETGVGTTVGGVSTTGTVGDGPHGSAGTGTGDFDFYKITGSAGKSVTVDIDSTGLPDSMVFVFDAAGNEVAFNDDSIDGLDSLLTFRVPTSGDYFVMVTGFFSIPNDPFDPASGTGFDAEGGYAVKISQADVDTDFYAVRLRKGDILGVSAAGSATTATIYDSVPREVHGSSQDATSIFPANTPLPGGGNAVTEHVVAKAGVYYIGVSGGSGHYDITVEVFRPFLEGQQPVQTVFLDFDGARVNTGIFGGPGVRELSPFRAFLGRWGFTRAQENALITQITRRVEENIKEDLERSGLNANFRIRVLNSRDSADPFGQPNVSRIIVGGSIAESGIPTIGISQSIDPGNFNTEETSLVLLDVLSDPAGDDASLNTYLTGASNKVRFVAQAVGNVVSHEAGHFFGNWHVDQFNDIPNLMDQGGNFPFLYGVGPDGVGGTADDPDVDFGEDTFNPGEGFTGTEDTRARILFGVTS